jgi:hypothetical protein
VGERHGCQDTEAESQEASPQATGPDTALTREAAAGLFRIVDEHGQASTTVRRLLSQFGHDALTEDAMDDVFEALRSAGLREDPMLSKGGLTLDSPIKVRRVEKHREKEERSFITWGFVGAVLFAPVGIFFGIRLLVRERLGPGLAVILVAVAVWGAGIVIVLGQAGAGPAAERFNAHDTTGRRATRPRRTWTSRCGSAAGRQRPGTRSARCLIWKPGRGRPGRASGAWARPAGPGSR